MTGRSRGIEYISIISLLEAECWLENNLPKTKPGRIKHFFIVDPLRNSWKLCTCYLCPVSLSCTHTHTHTCTPICNFRGGGIHFSKFSPWAFTLQVEKLLFSQLDFSIGCCFRREKSKLFPIKTRKAKECFFNHLYSLYSWRLWFNKLHIKKPYTFSIFFLDLSLSHQKKDYFPRSIEIMENNHLI